jgi:hypothetical protein
MIAPPPQTAVASAAPAPAQAVPAAQPTGFLAKFGIGRGRPAAPPAASQAPAASAMATAAPLIAGDPAAAGAIPGEPPYTLDSGDRLRIVVFGQDGLTNSYFVDAGGNVTMPLIGMVPARGQTTQELARVIAENCAMASSASRTWRSRSRSTGRSSSWAKSRIPASILTCPT